MEVGLLSIYIYNNRRCGFCSFAAFIMDCVVSSLGQIFDVDIAQKASLYQHSWVCSHVGSSFRSISHRVTQQSQKPCKVTPPPRQHSFPLAVPATNVAELETL